jgi:hypothetical protein
MWIFMVEVTKIDKTDRHPRYVAPNVPLEPSFGHSFPIGSTESGELSVQLELHDASGVNVTYNDRIQYIIEPCVITAVSYLEDPPVYLNSWKCDRSPVDWVEARNPTTRSSRT